MAAEAPRLGAVVLSRGWIGCGVAREGGGVRVGEGPLIRDPDGCADWPTRWQQDLQSFQPDHVLLMLSWPGLGDRKIQGDWLHPCSPVFDAYFQSEVSQALSVLGSTGARVFIATAPYFTADGAPAEAVDRVDCLNRTYREAATHTGAQILDLAGWVCPGGQCRRDENGVLLREDGLHFSGAGAVIAADWTLDHLARSTA
jgi:lysophospholipase L1-like esterase